MFRHNSHITTWKGIRQIWSEGEENGSFGRLVACLSFWRKKSRKILEEVFIGLSVSMCLDLKFKNVIDCKAISKKLQEGFKFDPSLVQGKPSQGLLVIILAKLFKFAKVLSSKGGLHMVFLSWVSLVWLGFVQGSSRKTLKFKETQGILLLRCHSMGWDMQERVWGYRCLLAKSSPIVPKKEKKSRELGAGGQKSKFDLRILLWGMLP